MSHFLKRGNVVSSSFSLEQEAWLDKLSVLSPTDDIEKLERTSKITGRSKFQRTFYLDDAIPYKKVNQLEDISRKYLFCCYSDGLMGGCQRSSASFNT